MTRIRSVHVFGLRKYQASALLRKIISMDSSALRLERLVIAGKDVRHIDEQMKKLAFSRLELADLKVETIGRKSTLVFSDGTTWTTWTSCLKAR